MLPIDSVVLYTGSLKNAFSRSPMNRRLLISVMMAIGCGSQQPIREQDVRRGGRPPSNWAKLALGPIPGFAGIDRLSYPPAPDSRGRMCVITIALTDTSVASRNKAQSFFARGDIGSPYPPGSCTSQRAFQFLKVKYDYAQLEGWQNALMANPSAVPMQVPVDDHSAPLIRVTRIMAGHNRVEVNVSDSLSRAKLSERATSLGIPKDAVVIDLNVPPLPLEVAMMMNSASSRPTIYFEFQVDKPAALHQGELERIAQAQGRELGIAGEVAVQFNVNAAGQPDVSTYKVLKSSDDYLPLFIRKLIPSLKYSAAEKEGKAVPQLVQVTFRFAKTM